MVRSLDYPSLEEGVAQLRIQAYPQFPETHDVEFYSSVYRWFERHPLGNEMYRWVAVADDGQNGSRVVGHLAATPQYYGAGGDRGRVPVGSRSGGAAAICGEAAERLQASGATGPFAGEKAPEPPTDRDRSRVREPPRHRTA